MSQPGEFDVERELVVAMNDYVGGAPVPAYDPHRIAASGRRHRQVWALAASVAAVAALGAGLALSGGGASRTVPAAQGTGTPSGPPTASSPAPVLVPADPARQRLALRTLVLAAERYENPATRGTVTLGQVSALFTDQAAYTRAWGRGGLGLTCGAVADGATSGDGASVVLYSGSTRLPAHATFAFDSRTNKVSGVRCARGQVTTGHWSDTISKVYGSVVSGGKSGDGLLGPAVSGPTCPTATPTVTNWFADESASRAGLTEWSVALNDGSTANGLTLTASVDRTGLLTRVTCGG
jgi:hypothetical protein